MSTERRNAVRYRVPPELKAEVGGVPVRVLDLSLIGAKIEHEARFALTSPELVLTWRGTTVSMPVSVVRSEVAGRAKANLVYHTGVRITASTEASLGVIASILRDPQTEVVATLPIRDAAPEPPSFDDSWVRRVRLLEDDLDEDLPYARYRLLPSGWEKDYVASAEQPRDGFTIPRDRGDFRQLQLAFEAADPETRAMMRIALESQLLASR